MRQTELFDNWKISFAMPVDGDWSKLTSQLRGLSGIHDVIDGEYPADLEWGTAAFRRGYARFTLVVAGRPLSLQCELKFNEIAFRLSETSVIAANDPDLPVKLQKSNEAVFELLRQLGLTRTSSVERAFDPRAGGKNEVLIDGEIRIESFAFVSKAAQLAEESRLQKIFSEMRLQGIAVRTRETSRQVIGSRTEQIVLEVWVPQALVSKARQLLARLEAENDG